MDVVVIFCASLLRYLIFVAKTEVLPKFIKTSQISGKVDSKKERNVPKKRKSLFADHLVEKIQQIHFRMCVSKVLTDVLKKIMKFEERVEVSNFFLDYWRCWDNVFSKVILRQQWVNVLFDKSDTIISFVSYSFGWALKNERGVK